MERVFRNEKYNWCDKLILWLLFPAFIYFSFISLTTALMGNEFLTWFVYGAKEVIYFAMLYIAMYENLVHKRKISVVWCLMLFLGYSAFLERGHRDYIYVVGFMLILRKYKINIILKKIYNIIFPTFIVMLSLCFLRVIPNIAFYRSESFVRYSLSFRHPNSVSMYIMMLMLLRLYVNNFEMKIYDFIFYLIVALSTFYLTDSRMSFLLLMTALVILFIYNLFKDKLKLKRVEKFIQNNWVKKIFVALPLLFFIGSLFCVLLYVNQFKLGIIINKLTSGRLYYPQLAFEDLRISVLGISFDNSIYILDNWYIDTFFSYGIVNTILILFAYMVMIYKIVEKKNYKMLFIVVIYLFAGLMESVLIDYKFNIFFVFFVSFLNDKFLDNGDDFDEVVNHNACLQW